MVRKLLGCALLAFCFVITACDSGTGPCSEGCGDVGQVMIQFLWDVDKLKGTDVTLVGRPPIPDTKLSWILYQGEFETYITDFIQLERKQAEYLVAVKVEGRKDPVLTDLYVGAGPGTFIPVKQYPLTHIVDGMLWFRIIPNSTGFDIQTTP